MTVQFTPDPKTWIHIDDAAERFGLQLDMIRLAILGGKIRVHSIGDRLYVHKVDIRPMAQSMGRTKGA